MQKRTSWDQKNKHIHKSRKQIIDTVFGREDNTQRVFGYEKVEDTTKREVGDRWTDSDGKEWEQKEGYKVSVSQMDDVREYLKKLTTCKNEECKTETYSRADKKMVVRTGYCVDCTQKLEQKLKDDGTYPFYEDYKITCNKIGWLRDYKQKMEDSLKYLKKDYQMVYENGHVENWQWGVDIDKVKKDLKKDIDNSYEALELLFKRKGLLEDKLRELNHTELIKN
jgi:hypothetical protein